MSAAIYKESEPVNFYYIANYHRLSVKAFNGLFMPKIPTKVSEENLDGELEKQTKFFYLESVRLCSKDPQ